jgi:hypothetical protein
MANAYAPGKTTLVEPPTGSYTNSWASPVNSNFSVIDASVSGTTTINAATITPGVPFVVLVFQNFEQNPSPQTNPLAGQNLRIRITGALSFNISVLIPANIPGFWIIDNQTSGNFDVSVKTTDPVSIPIQPLQGYQSLVFSDGVQVTYADLGTTKQELVAQGITVPTGAIIQFGSSAVPSGYLLCNGVAVSRITYAPLYGVIGTTWGPGDGTTTFNLPNLPSTTAAVNIIKS